MECPKCHSNSIFKGFDYDLYPPQSIYFCLICSFEWNESNMEQRLQALLANMEKIKTHQARK